MEFVYNLYGREVRAGVREYVQMWIEKRGSCLAIRIPNALAVEIGLGEGTQVELSLVKGQLIVALRSKTLMGLRQLLEKVTEENMHDEIKTRPAVDREAW